VKGTTVAPELAAQLGDVREHVVKSMAEAIATTSVEQTTEGTVRPQLEALDLLNGLDELTVAMGGMDKDKPNQQAPAELAKAVNEMKVVSHALATCTDTVRLIKLLDDGVKKYDNFAAVQHRLEADDAGLAQGIQIWIGSMLAHGMEHFTGLSAVIGSKAGLSVNASAKYLASRTEAAMDSGGGLPGKKGAVWHGEISGEDAKDVSKVIAVAERTLLAAPAEHIESCKNQLVKVICKTNILRGPTCPAIFNAIAVWTQRLHCLVLAHVLFIVLLFISACFANGSGHQ
jgi:hypothetical protein